MTMNVKQGQKSTFLRVFWAKVSGNIDRPFIPKIYVAKRNKIESQKDVYKRVLNIIGSSCKSQLSRICQKYECRQNFRLQLLIIKFQGYHVNSR